MPVYREWECPEHGQFVSTHPICNGSGCLSENVKRVFLTPPAIRSATTKLHDASLRKTADMYRMSDIRSAKEGERAAPPVGGEVLWGDKAAEFLRRPLHDNPKPSWHVASDGTKFSDSGLLNAALSGITRSPLPPAGEITASRADKGILK